MCDYSLCGIPNRLAVEGEELIVHKFSTGSMGLASAADLRPCEPEQKRAPEGWWQRIRAFFEGQPQAPAVPAVCVPPGAHLLVKGIPEDIRRLYRLEEDEGVVFVQISANVNSYRDAIQFMNGRQVRLQELPEGMRMELLSFAGVTHGLNERELALLG
jgi:hypothetical protein